jgi:hypothetical protein
MSRFTPAPRVRIPPSPQALSRKWLPISSLMAEGPPDRLRLAWAAGVYDGEGSCSAYLPKSRRTYRRQMAVSQGGEPGQAPEVLTRFRAAVLDVGNITGPYRGYLYYWKTTRKDALDQIAALLWPYLSEEKRLQFEAASSLAGRRGPFAVDRLTEPREIEVAWAAGFFDGEGTVAADKDPRTGRYRAINMEIPQSSIGGTPEVLLRFRRIVGVGNISGPYEPRSPWSRLPAYRWRSGALEDVESVAAVLFPWLGPVKRAQFENAIRLRRTGSRKS